MTLEKTIGGNYMKRNFLLGLLLCLAFLVTACNTDEEQTDKSKDSNNSEELATKKVGKDEKNEDTYVPQEPTEDTVCAFCNMVVYEKDHEMGVFSAQGVTKDGEYVFFDDSGCMLNYERQQEEKLAKKWVRDYVTSNWVEADKAVVVKADITTPMKYGYAFFETEGAADGFISESSNLNPIEANWETIDTVANERYQKKMQMKKQEQSEEETSQEGHDH